MGAADSLRMEILSARAKERRKSTYIRSSSSVQISCISACSDNSADDEMVTRHRCGVAVAEEDTALENAGAANESSKFVQNHRDILFKVIVLRLAIYNVLLRVVR